MLQFKSQASPGVHLIFDIEQVEVHKKTKYQQVLIAKLTDGTTGLFLDDEEQSTSEYCHEFNDQFASLTPEAERVLILGAGAGGVARGYLNKTHALIDQVDIDSEFIELAKDHLDFWHEGSFESPRVRTHITGVQDLDCLYSAKYDTIAFDLSVITEVACSHWNKQFFTTLIENHLKPQGSLVANLCWMGADHTQRVNDIFPTDLFLDYEVVVNTNARWKFIHLINRK